jgi:hypothetical protein
VTRRSLAAVDALSGEVGSWNPDLTGFVKKIAKSGGAIYAAGDFGKMVGETYITGLAAINSQTGEFSSWNPHPNLGVLALVVAGGRLYAGGNFSSIAGESRNALVAFDLSVNPLNPTLAAWNPQVSAGDPVTALAADNGIIYAGGRFASIGGENRSCLAAVSASTGLATPWNPNVNNYVYAIAVHNGVIYAGGQFFLVGEGFAQSRNYLAAFEDKLGGLLPWNPNPSSEVYALAISGESLYVGGRFRSIGRLPRRNIAAIKATTGEATNWAPDADVNVKAIVPYDGKLYVGGGFANISGVSRNHLAIFDEETGDISPLAPNFGTDREVSSIAASQGYVFVGGTFFGGLYSFLAETGDFTSWVPLPGIGQYGGTIAKLFIDENKKILYVAGNYDHISSTSRIRLSAFDISEDYVANPPLTPWNPGADDFIYAFAVGGETLYVGGNFLNIGGQQRSRLAAFDTTTGSLLPWNPAPNRFVTALAVKGDTLYAGGQFETVGGITKNYLAAIDTNTGSLKPWSPATPSSAVWSLGLNGEILYAGGELFNKVGDEIQDRLVQFGSYPKGFDYDRDNWTDIAAYHLPSHQYFTSYGGNLGQYGYGAANDCYPLIWDLDGDFRAEISFYHVPSSQWFVKGYPAPDGNMGQGGWNQDDCIPVPGDYDGDGKMERAFYHWPTNRWFIERKESPGEFAGYDFGYGMSDSIPIAADFNGDGRTDLALYNIRDNQWFIYGPGNVGRFGWMGEECIPVPGDWNGDGKCDLGIYCVTDNVWLWREWDNPEPHFIGQFGWGGWDSFPIPGDYLGTGQWGKAVYRPLEDAPFPNNRWLIDSGNYFNWGYDGENFIPITTQMAVYNWFRFKLGMFQ